MSRSFVRAGSEVHGDGRSVMQLVLQIDDPVVVGYLQVLEEPDRSAKALEALKVGVIAIQSASPTLDTQVVQAKFKEVEASLKEQVNEFKTEIAKKLEEYFREGNGQVPKSVLGRTFSSYFDPEAGKLARVIQSHVGPTSTFGRAVDPKNKEGLLSLIEKTVRELVEGKLSEVLAEFSLDDKDSAMSQLKAMLEGCLGEFKKALGHAEGKAEEAQRGHNKGFDFEADVYERIAQWGRQMDDETEMVRGVPSPSGKKVGDYLIKLGEATGAPGRKIVVETKDQRYTLKKAMAELQEAKKNREATCGIFVFAKGCEPPEVGDFHRIGDDFFCTVDKEALAAGQALPFLWAAYAISRVMAVAAVRKEAGGQLDLERIHGHVDALLEWVPQLGDIMSKANTIQRSGDAIETTAKKIKEDMEKRLNEILELLRLAPAE